MKAIKIISAVATLWILMAGTMKGIGIYNDLTNTNEPATRTEITKDDLPGEVVKSHKSGEFATMEINAIYKVKNEAINEKTGHSVLFEIVGTHNSSHQAVLVYSETGELIRAGKKSSPS